MLARCFTWLAMCLRMFRRHRAQARGHHLGQGVLILTWTPGGHDRERHEETVSDFVLRIRVRQMLA
jgi:hypothetical protein